MSLSSTVLLGAIAGVTILIGLPLGRLRRLGPGVRVFLSASAVGVLVFLLWDVLSAAWAPLDEALAAVHDGRADAATIAGYGTLFVAGLTAGLLSLVAYESWRGRRRAGGQVDRARVHRADGPGVPALVGAGPTGGGGGGAAVTVTAGVASARELALLIAVGIGLHNFAEGLAIGQSAASGQVGLATLLVVGFGLHNATEGFGIVAPLAAGDTRPSWALLLGLGVIGGGPTFLGAGLGHNFTNEPVSVAFLSLAGGSILYVIVQLVTIAARAGRRELFAYGLLLGLVAGFATDAVVTAAGI